MIELRTLGALELTSADGRAIGAVLAQPRRAALLCYLALATPRGFHRRDTLFALFWPDDSAEQARHALRQSVYILRRALGPTTIVSRGDEELALAPDQLGCDAWAFDAAVDQGRPADALALYRGELLAGFHISAAPGFERWLDEERDRLRQRAGEVGWALAVARERDGDAAGAAAAARRALALSPTDESALRRLIFLLERLGDRAAAVQVYQAFARTLQQEYDMEPSAETRAAMARIRADPGESQPTPSREPRVPIQWSNGRRRGATTGWRHRHHPARIGCGAERLGRPPKGKASSLSLVAMVMLLMGGWWAMRARSGGTGSPSGVVEPPRSIAVLPFRNLRGDSSGEYFSDGVTEEILYALMQVPELRVAARASAFRFKGQAIDAREVGRRLGVAAVLEGSIQREGDEVRITAQLIDTRNGSQIWSGKFDGHLADLFAVEDEISQALAEALKVRLGLIARSVPGSTPVKAHDLYLRGLSLLAVRGPALQQSIAYFQGAISSHSSFAPAWAGLAAARELLPAYGLASFEEELPGAEQAARRAIALDSTLGPAYAVLGSVYRDRMQWAAAEAAFARALRWAPSDAEALEQYGQFLFWTGQAAAAVPWMERARTLDPLAPIPATTVGTAQLFLHHYDSAATLLRHASELAPGLALPLMWRMWAELMAGRYDVAEQAGRGLAQASGVDPDIYSGLIHAVADSRRRGEALALLSRTPASASWGLSGDYRVNWLVLLGDTAGALAAVDRLGTRPTPNGVLTLWNPTLDPIRDHPRFQATLRRLGLPYRGQRRP